MRPKIPGFVFTTKRQRNVRATKTQQIKYFLLEYFFITRHRLTNTNAKVSFRARITSDLFDAFMWWPLLRCASFPIFATKCSVRESSQQRLVSSAPDGLLDAARPLPVFTQFTAVDAFARTRRFPDAGREDDHHENRGQVERTIRYVSEWVNGDEITGQIWCWRATVVRLMPT